MTLVKGTANSSFQVHPVHPVHPIAEAGNRAPVDAEVLITWAIRRSGRLPWLSVRDRDLAFDRGVTARPHRAPDINWTIAEACAGLRFSGRPVRPLMSPGPDGARVLMAIGLLDPATASLVIACGRSGIRPDWMEGVVARRVVKTRRDKRKHRRAPTVAWEPCHPDTIRLAREAYRRWHAGVAAVARRLRDGLDGWEIAGFAAPFEPWLAAPEKNACNAQNSSQDRADHDRAGGRISS